MCIWPMHMQAGTSLFVPGALRIGPVVDVGQDGGPPVVVVFWSTHQWNFKILAIENTEFYQ